MFCIFAHINTIYLVVSKLSSCHWIMFRCYVIMEIKTLGSWHELNSSVTSLIERQVNKKRIYSLLQTGIEGNGFVTTTAYRTTCCGPCSWWSDSSVQPLHSIVCWCHFSSSNETSRQSIARLSPPALLLTSLSGL